MCGIAGVVGAEASLELVKAMVKAQRHRGPDAAGDWQSESGKCVLGHCRLAIIDLSPAGKQPMLDPSGRYSLVFNGEIYNYRELRSELADSFPFRTQTDSEVLLAAYRRWGATCLDRLLGMFAFAIWDEQERTLFAARDRFGVKPFYYARDSSNGLVFASEIKGILASGIVADPDPVTWAGFLESGEYGSSSRTFWRDVQSLPAGSHITWTESGIRIERWYDIADRVGDDVDQRDERIVTEEYQSLLRDSVKLRFRSDVPVGINLSGGLDSSVLLGAVHLAQGADCDVKAFTFVCGDPDYDELPWVRCLLEQTAHENVVCELRPEDVPRLAEEVYLSQDEPYGGLPTLAYAQLFERAREMGVIVFLDGQGMDEQWAGYDYYRTPHGSASIVQGSRERPVRPDCLLPEFRAMSEPELRKAPFSDPLRNLQYRDLVSTKLPRALRFNDRVSMRVGTELREPFLDHRLVELALRQPAERKIQGDVGKWLLRKIAATSLPTRVVNSPKRALQTPQREWLRGPLRDWAVARIDATLQATGGSWLDAQRVRSELSAFLRGDSDNSFYVWQWLSVSWPLQQFRTCAI